MTTDTNTGGSAESAVLGAVLIDNAVLADLRGTIEPDDFGMPRHRAIWLAFLALADSGTPIDYVTAVEQVARLRRIEREKRDGMPEAFDVGMDYLAELAEHVPTSANAAFYAMQVRAAAIRRRMLALAQDVAEEAADAQDVAEWLLSVEQRVTTIARDRALSVGTTARHALREWATATDEDLDEGAGQPCAQWGLDDLDNALPLMPHRLTICAGETGSGKTTLACAALIATAVRNGVPAAIWHLRGEMTRRDLMHQILSATAGVASDALRAGELTEEEWRRLNEAHEAIAAAPLTFHTADRWAGDVVARQIEQASARRGLRLAVIDYLGLLDAPGSQHPNRKASKIDALDENARILRQASAGNVHVLLLAQPNRNMERRSEREPGKVPTPRLSDLAYAGEHHAPNVAFVLEPAKYSADARADLRRVHVLKARDGRKTTVPLRLVGEQKRFTLWPVEDVGEQQRHWAPAPRQTAVDRGRQGDRREQDDYDDRPSVLG